MYEIIDLHLIKKEFVMMIFRDNQKIYKKNSQSWEETMQFVVMAKQGNWWWLIYPLLLRWHRSLWNHKES